MKRAKINLRILLKKKRRELQDITVKLEFAKGELSAYKNILEELKK